MGWGSVQNGRGLWRNALTGEMHKHNHQAGLMIVGETLPQERNRTTLADEKDQYVLPVTRVTYSLCENDTRLIAQSLNFMEQTLGAPGGSEIWRENDDTCHLYGTARMGRDPSTSVVNADCQSWDVGGVHPSLTSQAIACRSADRIVELPARDEL